MIDTQVVLSLIKAVLDCTPVTVQDDFPVEEYLSFARDQQIETILIAGLHKAGFPVTKELRNIYIQSVWMSNRQIEAACVLYAAFDSNKIDYMPLKGGILKSLYPSEELRSMGDIDILVRMEQYDRIRALMLSNGYQEQTERDHEFVWNKEGIKIELHRRLIPSFNKDYYAYYGDGWQNAKPVDGTYRFEMSITDTFVYLFTHFAKHYRDAGVGIRQALDLYVYKRNYSLSEEYIQEKMRLLKLDRFYANTMHMLDVWFGSVEHTEASKLISDRLFASGVFGTRENSLNSSMLKQINHQGSMKKAKISTWMKRVFVPYDGMRQLYPCLKKCPVLLPFMWIVRWGNILLHKRNRFMEHVQEDSMVTDDSVKEYQEMLHKSGLDFNFR
jgi:hypothetical protein